NWCAGPPFVSVVQREPSGATCGSRYVAPCGMFGPVGIGIGADQSLCVPFALAVAHETTACGVQQPVKSTHIAQMLSTNGLAGLRSIAIHCLSGSLALFGYGATISGWPPCVSTQSVAEVAPCRRTDTEITSA